MRHDNELVYPTIETDVLSTVTSVKTKAKKATPSTLGFFSLETRRFFFPDGRRLWKTNMQNSAKTYKKMTIAYNMIDRARRKGVKGPNNVSETLGSEYETF